MGGRVPLDSHGHLGHSKIWSHKGDLIWEKIHSAICGTTKIYKSQLSKIAKFLQNPERSKVLQCHWTPAIATANKTRLEHKIERYTYTCWNLHSEESYCRWWWRTWKTRNHPFTFKSVTGPRCRKQTRENWNSPIVNPQNQEKRFNNSGSRIYIALTPKNKKTKRTRNDQLKQQ